MLSMMKWSDVKKVLEDHKQTCESLAPWDPASSHRTAECFKEWDLLCAKESIVGPARASDGCWPSMGT